MAEGHTLFMERVTRSPFPCMESGSRDRPPIRRLPFPARHHGRGATHPGRGFPPGPSCSQYWWPRSRWPRRCGRSHPGPNTRKRAHRKRWVHCTRCGRSPKPAPVWKACSQARPRRPTGCRWYRPRRTARRGRARYVDAAQAKPSLAGGWILNTETQVPQAGCPGRQAVVKVWRKPVAQELARDGKRQVRIYLQDAHKQAAAGQMRPLPEYSAVLDVSAGRCG